MPSRLRIPDEIYKLFALYITTNKQVIRFTLEKLSEESEQVLIILKLFLLLPYFFNHLYIKIEIPKEMKQLSDKGLVYRQSFGSTTQIKT